MNDHSFTIGDALHTTADRLQQAGILTARLDTFVLLEDIVGIDRTQLLAHPDLILTSEQQEKLDDAIVRRTRHEPLAYIRQRTEFYGRPFYVDARVLEPRPESEALIDALKQLKLSTIEKERWCVVDLGTGSGALAITANLELPTFDVYATDIDPACLEVTSQNIKKLGAKVTLAQGNLLEPLIRQKVDFNHCVLLCNLPYVPDGMAINKAAEYEPRRALFGGTDGLDVYRRLFQQINHLTTRPTYVLTESLPAQHAPLDTIAKQHGYQLNESAGFAQTFSRL